MALFSLCVQIYPFWIHLDENSLHRVLSNISWNSSFVTIVTRTWRGESIVLPGNLTQQSSVSWLSVFEYGSSQFAGIIIADIVVCNIHSGKKVERMRRIPSHWVAALSAFKIEQVNPFRDWKSEVLLLLSIPSLTMMLTCKIWLSCYVYSTVSQLLLRV